MQTNLTRTISVAGALLLIGLTLVFLKFQQASEVEHFVEIIDAQNTNLAHPLSNLMLDQFASQLSEFNALTPDEIRTHPSRSKLDRLVLNMVQGTSVVRVNIFVPSGRVVYSTAAEEIGSISDSREKLGDVLKYGPASQLKMPVSMKGISRDVQNGEVIETLLPLNSAKSDFVGILGLQTDVTQVVELTHDTSVRTTIAVLLALLIMLATLVYVSSRASKVSNRQLVNLKSYQEALTDLHGITATTDQDSGTTIKRIIELGTQVFDLPIGVLGRSEGENYIVENTVGCGETASPGDLFKTSDTFCSLAIGADKPVAYNKIGQSDLVAKPYYKTFEFEAYTGAPVYVGGERYGVLAFASLSARNAEFTDNDLSLLRLFALWIGKEIEREQTQSILHRNVDTLTSLHTIATTAQSTPTENIRKIIQLGIQSFGLDMGIVGQVTNDTYIFAHVYGSEEAPPVGTELPMADTYCQFAFRAKGPLGLHDVTESAIAGEPCHEKLGLESYLGTPLFVDGNRWGTLCFASGQKRDHPFSENDLTLIQLFASWIGTEIHRDQSAERERLLARLLDTTREGYWSIDSQGITLDLNPAMSKILGQPRDSIIGHSIFDFVDETNGQIFRHEIARRRRGESDAYEINLLKPDGTPISCINNATPAYNDRGEMVGSIGLWTDISVIKTAQEKAQIALKNAEEANESKSRFLASASHDLRQPLQALNLFVAILKSTKNPEKIAATVDKLEGSINVLGSLLNALLDISKLEAGLVPVEHTIFKVSELFDSIDEFSSIAASQSLGFKIVPSSLVIHSDRNLLESILRNLISNALKYTETGKILVGCRRRSDQVRIDVYDTGVGISPDHSDLIYEEFFQVDNDARNREEGLGLGLSIVRRTAELLGITIKHRSILGQGSMFSVTLPLAEQQLPQKIEQTRTDMDAAANSLVMVIDDDVAVLEGMELLLESLGCEVISSNYANDPISENEKLLTQCSRPPDLIIADYRLPGEDTGVEVIGKLREGFHEQVPAILLTGEISKDFLAEGDQGKFQILNKPINAEKLIAVMNEILGEPRG